LPCSVTLFQLTSNANTLEASLPSANSSATLMLGLSTMENMRSENGTVRYQTLDDDVLAVERKMAWSEAKESHVESVTIVQRAFGSRPAHHRR